MPTPRRPNPNPPPSQSPSAGPGSSDDSSTASAPTRSNGQPRLADGGVFVADPGPAFDPQRAPEPELAPPTAPEPALEWDEGTVRSILTAKGTVVHALVGVGEEDWLYLQHELDAIAPPLTRILNRYPATRAAAEGGDAIAIVIGLSGYVTRSYVERRAALAELEQAEPEPVSGARAPAGTGPEHDPAHQAAIGEPPQWQTQTR